MSPPFRPHCIIDTNVVLSYVLFRRPPITECVDHIWRNGVVLYSDALLREYSDVLFRPKFDRLGRHLERLKYLSLLLSGGQRVEPTDTPPLCRDPKDDMLLALAQAGEADFLITGDRDLLDLGAIGGTRILSPADFVALLA